MRHSASVLVIENDPTLRAAIGEALGRLDMEPFLASGLDAALEALSSGGCAPDCIVVDLDRQPWGLAALARLHAHPDAGDVPVLALGSHPHLLMSARADAVMLKPLDVGALRERLVGICDRAPMQ
jgi:DNA-binding response OmpR family regulator